MLSSENPLPLKRASYLPSKTRGVMSGCTSVVICGAWRYQVELRVHRPPQVRLKVASAQRPCARPRKPTEPTPIGVSHLVDDVADEVVIVVALELLLKGTVLNSS